MKIRKSLLREHHITESDYCHLVKNTVSQMIDVFGRHLWTTGSYFRTRTERKSISPHDYFPAYTQRAPLTKDNQPGECCIIGSLIIALTENGKQDTAYGYEMMMKQRLLVQDFLQDDLAHEKKWYQGLSLINWNDDLDPNEGRARVLQLLNRSLARIDKHMRRKNYV